MAPELNFDKLTKGNYFEWCIYMEALLVRKNLLDIVNGTTRHPGGTEGSKKVRKFYRKQDKACAKLILRITLSQLAHCRNCDPYVIWSDLATVHSSHSCSTTIALHCRFHRLHLEKGKTVSAYVARVCHIAFLLKETGINVYEDDLIILAITARLLHLYNSFLISLNATANSNYTLNTVIACLINEYQRQHQTAPRQPTTNNNPKCDKTLAVSPNQVTCFKCHKKGHFRSNCPEHTSSMLSTTTEAANVVASLSGYDSDEDGVGFS